MPGTGQVCAAKNWLQHEEHGPQSKGGSDSNLSDATRFCTVSSGQDFGGDEPMQEAWPEAVSLDPDDRTATNARASVPCVVDTDVQVGELRFSYAVCTQVGVEAQSKASKKQNQDTWTVAENVGGSGHVFFGVFDGHGEQGAAVAKLLAEKLPGMLTCCQKFQARRYHRAFTAAYAECNQHLCHSGQIDCLMSGSTAITALLLRDGRLLVANVGDSRCIVGRVSQDRGVAEAISMNRDHRPDCREEAQRIFRSEGRILKRNMSCPGRVYLQKYDVPGLAMTRAFGDTLASRVGVISDPDMSLITLSSADEYLLFCSDGITTHMQNDELVQHVHTRAQQGWGPSAVARELVEVARERWMQNVPGGYVDDCTVIVCYVAAKPDPPGPEVADHGVLRSWVKRKRPATGRLSTDYSTKEDRRSLDRAPSGGQPGAPASLSTTSH